MSIASDGVQRITADATRTIGRLEPFWANQIIHPTESLLTDWGRDFLKMLAEAGAARQHVRIYNQPEAAIRVAADGTITYDWSQFDRMARMILATGNALKVVFFGMPYELAAYPEVEKIRPNGARICISPPRDYVQWQALCADFTRHVIATYGLEEARRWSFRCWNEPDLGNFWRNMDLAEYMKLYDHFAKGVKDVCPDIRIGGPALSSSKTYKEPQNFRLFLEHLASGTNHATGEIGAPIDFLGIHTYGGQSGGGAPGREYPDVDYLLEQQLRLADMRDEYPALKGLPIHVEEWGESSGGTRGVEDIATANVRNTEHAAAFMVAWVERHLRMRREQDRGFVSFTFCSSGYEKPPARDFMGYRTFHTKNGFEKPILNAYRLLAKLAPEEVAVDTVSGAGPVLAFGSRDVNRITVVMVNYQCACIENEGPACAVHLHVTPHWEADKQVTVSHWHIDGKHSNAYAAFHSLGAPAEPTPEQITAVKLRMGLERLDPPETMAAAALGDLSFELPCNAVSLVEITIAQKS